MTVATEAFKLCLSGLLLALLSSPNDAGNVIGIIAKVKACKKMKAQNPNAPSGTHVIQWSSDFPIEVYCEMGLNGGGYTFLSPRALSHLTQNDLSEIFTNTTTFLMRVRKTDGTQPYAVLRQLPAFASIPLKIGLSENAGYNGPVNINEDYPKLHPPFLFFGFLPIVNASNSKVHGLDVNGIPVTFTRCETPPYSQITLFPNFSESMPWDYDVNGAYCQEIFSNTLPNPSGRVMPPEYFMFAETHWGECGCYVQTNQLGGIGVLGVNIGFK